MNRFARLTAAFGIVFAMVLGAPTPAKADPITAAIVTAVGFTGTAAAVATFVINGVFSAAFSWAAGKLMGKSKASVQERQASVTTLSLGEVPREALIGEAVTGGSLIDAFNHGGQYGTDYVTRCIALVDHAVDDLVGYYIDDQYYAFSANGVQGGFSGTLDIEFVNATEAGAAPPARFLTASGGSWISTDVLAGITHVWFSYKCDETVWPQGHPQVRFLLRGLKVYDPRKDAALGYEGEDAQTWSDPSTHAFTRNAALLRYAFARGIYAEGRQGEPEHLLIGRGLSAEEAPPEPVIAAANLCDEDVDGNPRYTANGVIRASDDFIFVEEMFAAAMAGVIVQREGGVEIEPGQAKAAVVTITDADLVAGEPVSFSEFLSDGDGGRINTVVPRYIEPAQTWKDHSGPVRRDLDDIATDGGPREITLPLMLVTDGGQADRCAEITRLLGRLEKRGTIVLPPEFGRLEEGDWIAWTSARRFGGATVRFRIESWTLDEKWRMRLSLREIAAAAYGEPEPLTDESDPPSDPLDLDPLELQDVTADVVLLEGTASGVPAVRFAWSAPDPAVIAIRAEVRRVGETVAAPTRTDEINDLEMTVTNGVGPDQDIEVRLVPITRRSRPVAASDWIALTTGGLTAGDVTPITPGTVAGTPTISITSTIASDGTQTSRLFGSWTAPSDALTYIVELDNGTIVVQIPTTENAIEDRIVATGPTYRYRVKAISRTGTLSAAWSSWSGNAAASGDATIPPKIVSGSVTAVGGRRLHVVIKRPTLAACPDYLHALLYRNTTGFSPDDVPQDHIAIVSGETYPDINVNVGTLYRYWARSVDRSGNEAGEATFLGSATPVFVSTGGGDVSPTDPTLVNTEIRINPRNGALTGIGTGAGTEVANLQAAFAPRRAFNFVSGVDGFSALGATLADSGGVVILTATTSDPILYSPALGLQGRLVSKIRVRLRRTTAAAWEGVVYYATGDHGESSSYYKALPDPGLALNEWTIVEWDMSSIEGGGSVTDWLTNTIGIVRFDFTSTSGAVFEIDWIAFGAATLDQVGVRGIEDGANVTGNYNAAGVTGGSDWIYASTILGLTPLIVGNRSQHLDNTTGLLDNLTSVTTRPFNVLTGRTADHLNYVGGGGASVEALRPSEAGANVTGSHNAAGVTGASDWLFTAIPTTHLTRPGSNILFNGGFRLGAQGWLAPTYLTVVLNEPVNGPYAYFNYNGPLTPIYPTPASGTTMTLSGEASHGGSLGLHFVYVVFYDAADAYVGEGAYVCQGQSWARDSSSVVVPATATKYRLYSYAAVPGAGYCAFRKVKLEIGSAATPWSDEATNGALYRSGATIDSLEPGEIGANVTGSHDAAGVTGASNYLFSTDFVHATGATRPADNAGTTLTLIDVTGSTSTRGNSITNVAGGSAYYYVRSDIITGPCFAEMDISASAWSMVGLSIIAGGSSINQSILLMFNAAGNWEVFKDAVSQGSGTIAAASSGKIRVVYDGIHFKTYINGAQFGGNIAAGADLALFPKFFAYTNGITYTGLNCGPYTDRSFANIGGPTRPSDYAGTSLVLVPYNSETTVQGNKVTKTGGSHGGWGAGVQSRDKFAGAANCSFRFGDSSTAPYTMAGLASASFAGTYATLNYCLFTEGNPASSSVRVYQDGSFVATAAAIGAWALTDVWSVAYNGTQVLYLQNGVVRHTTENVAAGQVLGFAASMVYISNFLSDIQVAAGPEIPRIGYNTRDNSGGGLLTRNQLVTADGNAAGVTGGSDWIFLTTAPGLTPVVLGNRTQHLDNTTGKLDSITSITIRGALADRDTVGAAQMESNAVTTVKVQAGSITPDFYENTTGAVLWTTESTEKTVQTKAATVVRGKVRITALVDVVISGLSGASANGILRLKRDGSELFNAQRVVTAVGASGTWRMPPQIMLDYLDDPGAGTFTYTLTFQPSEAVDGQILRRSLFIQPLQG